MAIVIITNPETGEVTTREMTADEIAARQAIADANATAKANAAMALIDRQGNIVKALGAALFETINDVRVLKGQQPITAQQFRTYIKSKL